MPTIANRLFDVHEAEGELEDALEASGAQFKRLSWDSYDCSVELYDVPPEHRLSEASQRAVYDAGFAIAFVNHTDGWETHYRWDRREPFSVKRGWRRRWVEDPAATTTRSIGARVTPENSGYYEISYWPDSWGDDDKHGWRASGYMRIVPDPLESVQS
jgi:hypothetical protein